MYHLLKYMLSCSFLLVLSVLVQAVDFKRPIDENPEYDHDRWETVPREWVFEFRAYISSFDTFEDDGKAWGIPDFVAYEIKKVPGGLGKSPDRPSSWITPNDLYEKGLAPKDATYRYSNAFRSAHKDWYVRGHLCMKLHAWRHGEIADWNTHTVINAVPQRGRFNSGIWLDLENKTADWADLYGAVWIVTGPVFESNKPRAFLGESRKGEMEIAIPEALFKIVIRESEDPERPHVLAFIYPQSHASYGRKDDWNHEKFLVPVDEIEEKTDLDFLTEIPDGDEEAIESSAAKELWK